MKLSILIILALAALAGCKSADSPGHNWRPPGSFMAVPVEKGGEV